MQNAADEFCCNGCRQVYALLHDKGLDGYYTLLKNDPPICAVPAQISTDTYASLEDENLLANAFVAPDTVDFFVNGLNCSACLWLLEKLPQLCADISAVQVDMSRSLVRVTRVTGKSFAKAAQTINRLGYRPVLVKNTTESEALVRYERRQELIRIGVAGAATGNIMLLAVAIYAGADGIFAQQFRWVTAALSALVLTYCAMPFYRQALAALRARSINIDLPIVAAIVSGILVSVHGLWSGAETLYFDSLSMLVFLLLSSRFLLANIQRHYLNTSHLEDELLNGTFTRITPDGGRELVSAESIRENDILEFSSDNQVPVDGEVTSGSGALQAAALTGESRPIELIVGSTVEAGSRYVEGRWTVRVVHPPAQTRLAQILRDAEELSKKKPNFVKFADNVGQAFIAAVFLIAIATIAYFSQNDVHEGIARAMALIIVTCPCVFGMAIPLSMALGIREAAANGIVIKDADVLERILKVKDLYFDKTGTLTTGELKVLGAVDFTVSNEGFAAAAALEANQSHPVAKAIKKFLKDEPVTFASEVAFLTGGGISGIVNGKTYSIISMGLTSDETGPKLTSSHGVHRDNELLAVFHFADDVRTEAANTIREFKKYGINCGIISGDRTDVVSACAEEVGVAANDVYAEASPERKAWLLKAAGERGAMVGDGANDASALAAANVGIAIRGSMDVSLRAADVYLMKNSLDGVPLLFAIARRARRAIIRNLVFSASFNLISGTLAIAGFMTPLWAAILMPLSSVTVLLSALAVQRHGGAQT